MQLEFALALVEQEVFRLNHAHVLNTPYNLGFGIADFGDGVMEQGSELNRSSGVIRWRRWWIYAMHVIIYIRFRVSTKDPSKLGGPLVPRGGRDFRNDPFSLAASQSTKNRSNFTSSITSSSFTRSHASSFHATSRMSSELFNAVKSEFSLPYSKLLRREASSSCTLTCDDPHEVFKVPRLLPELRSVKDEGTQMMHLPNEMLLEILIWLPASELVKLRGLNRLMKQMSEVHLIKMLEKKLDSIKTLLDTAKSETEETERRKRPLLLHYQSFLRVPTDELGELAWMRSCVNVDLRTVCLVVVIMAGEFDEQLPTLTGMTTEQLGVWIEQLDWLTIRKCLTRPSFKRWCRTMPQTFENMLTNGIDETTLLKTDVCDNLIIAKNLSYERMREISDAGYRLLIIAAAGLQFTHVSEELLQGTSKVAEIHEEYVRLRTYVALIR